MRRSSREPGTADAAELLEGSAHMSDPETVRKDWARRVVEAYDGWPQWLAPGAAPQALPWAAEGTDSAGDGAAADEPTSHSSSGWSWGIPADQMENLDRRLERAQWTGATARALRNERRYWGLESGDD
jgi:hypothetical protein